MSLNHSPSIVTDGLVFYYDMNNTKKSWKGAPVTNLYGDFGTSGSLRPNTTSTWNNTLGFDVNVGTIWKFTSGALNSTWSGNSYGYMYKDIATTNAVVYTGSAYCYVSTDCNISYLPVVSETTGGYACANLSGQYDLNKKGTWQRLGISTTGVGTTSRFLVYPYRLGVTDGSFTGYFQVCGVQFEQGSFATPFTATSRDNTQALLDLTNKNTLTATSLTYAADNTFSFNGSMVLSGLTINNLATTWEAWIKCTSYLNTYNMFMGSYLPYFGFHEANKLYFSNIIGGTQQTISTAANLSLNTWYHATFTTSPINGSNTLASIYLNGNLAQSAVQTGLQNEPGSQFTVGDGQASTWYPFIGDIPSVKVYNRALSAAEVWQNFNATRSRYGI